jgi:hypothetical protein
MASFPLPISSYELPVVTASSQRLMNCYASPAPQGGKSAVVLSRAPGIETFSVISSAAGVTVRGLHVMDGVLYALVGATLYAVDENGVATSVGTVPGDERVRMDTNGTDLVIVRPTVHTAYACDGAATAQITDGVFLGFTASDVTYLDGYLVFLVPASQQFFSSGLNALTFDALDTASAEASHDNLVAIFADHQEIVMAGTVTTELWYDAANEVGSPFSRSTSAVITCGLAAAAGIGAQDNSVFWLANDRTIRRLAGNAPQKVSTLGIDSSLRRMASVEDCFCLTYAQDGHMFVAFTFPTDERTLVYDATTSLWHERESTGYGPWRPSWIVECYGKQIVGDAFSGKLGILDSDSLAEFGEAQRMQWTYNSVYSENRNAIHRRFEMVCNTGYGTLSGQGENPLATLEVSDDGGETFRTFPTKSLGRRGEYRTRVVWTSLGAARQRVYRISISDPVPVLTLATVIEVEGMRA